MGSTWPKMALNRPQMDQSGVNVAQGGTKQTRIGPKWGQCGPRWHSVDPKWTKMGSIRPKMALNRPKMGSRCPKLAPYPHLVHDGVCPQDVVLLGGVGGRVFDGPRRLAGGRQPHHHQDLPGEGDAVTAGTPAAATSPRRPGRAAPRTRLCSWAPWCRGRARPPGGAG